MIQNEIHRDRDCFTKQPSLAKVKQQNILSLSLWVCIVQSLWIVPTEKVCSRAQWRFARNLLNTWWVWEKSPDRTKLECQNNIFEGLCSVNVILYFNIFLLVQKLEMLQFLNGPLPDYFSSFVQTFTMLKARWDVACKTHQPGLFFPYAKNVADRQDPTILYFTQVWMSL